MYILLGLLFIGIVFVTESLFCISMESAFLVSLLVMGIYFTFSGYLKNKTVMTETDKLAELLVSLINKEKEINRIEVLSNKMIINRKQEFAFSDYGCIKPLAESEIKDCVCRMNILFGKKYGIEEIGKYYGPIDTGNYETELIEPLYGKSYTVTRKIVYEGGFSVYGYALVRNNTKSTIQKNWEIKNYKKKLKQIFLILVSIVLLFFMVVVIMNDSKKTKEIDSEIVQETDTIVSVNSGEQTIEAAEVVNVVENNYISGHLEKGKKDWYEYVAPISGEYMFALFISNEECMYKLTIYQNEDEKVETISTEYDGVEKVNLEEGEVYKFFIRQDFAVNISDDPLDYAIQISY